MGLAILGDIMLGRHQAQFVKRYGLNKILSQLLPIVENRKIIANLECPLVDVKSSKNNNKLSKLSAKEECAEILSKSGFKALSLGNNHIFDFGVEGLINTQALLNKHSIKYFGAGVNKEKAIEPAIININNYTFGLLGFSFTNRAERDKAGVAYLYDDSVEIAIKQIRDKVDFIIVMPHSGIELYEYPLERDQKVYRKMIELGADLIVGSQPHCVQAREIYLDKYIYYSTGDLLFDHFHDETWADFNTDISHVKKYSLTPNRNLPLYSIMIIVDIVDDNLIVDHKPIFNKDGFNPILIDSIQKSEWENNFELLNDKLQNDASIQNQRLKIEKKLIQDLIDRGVINNE